MATTVGRLQKGNLLLIDTVDELTPTVTSGLIAKFPLDGQTNSASLWGGGTSGKITADSAIHDTTHSNYPLQPGQVLKFTGWFKKTADWVGDFWFFAYQKHNGTWGYNTAQFGRTFPADEWTYVEASYTLGYSGETITEQKQGVSVRNNATAGTLMWKDCHCFVVNTDAESNLTYASDAIYIEDGTTNLFPNGNFTDGLTGWKTSANATTMERIMTPYGWGVRVNREDGDGGNWPLNAASGVSFTAGTTYTFSMKYRIVRSSSTSTKPFNVGAWGSDTGNSNYNPYNLSCTITDLGNGWNHLYASYTFRAAMSATALPINSIPDYTTIDFADVQLEAKEFPTAVANTTRSGTGSLTLPLNSTGNWTIFYRFTPDMFWPTTSATGNINKKMWDIYDRLTGKSVFMNDYFINTTADSSNPWIGFDNFIPSTGPGIWHWHYGGTKWKAKKEYWFALTKTSGGVWTKYFIDEDGYKTQTTTHTYADLVNFQAGEITFSGQYNWQVKDVHIYNRALTEDEIKKLGNITLSMSKAGAIKNEVHERPVLPYNMNYIPLGLNSGSTNGICNPTEETNLIYSNEGVWVGSSYTNLFTHSSAGTFSVTSGKALDVLYYQNDQVVYRNNFTGETMNYKGRDISITSGVTYSISVDIYVSEDFNGTYSRMFSVEQTGSKGFDYDMNKKGTWQTFNHTITPAANANTRILMYPCPNNATATAGYVLYRNIQVVGLPFMPPFVNGTASASSLEYNLNTSLALNWGGNWSIVYWKKAMGTYINTSMTNFNLESLGCNSNSVGGGYVYWGKSNSGYEIETSSPGTMNASDYFGKWHMVSLVKNGTTLTIKHWGVGPNTHTRTVNVTSTAANYYVTQYGYDFKLGGWDNSNPSNSYFRDLIVGTRALSDSELDTLYKTQIRAYKNGKAQIQGQIMEGKVL